MVAAQAGVPTQLKPPSPTGHQPDRIDARIGIGCAAVRHVLKHHGQTPLNALLRNVLDAATCEPIESKVLSLTATHTLGIDQAEAPTRTAKERPIPIRVPQF